MRTLLLAGTAALVISQAAMAQAPNNSPNNSTNDTANQSGSGQHLRSNLKNMLEKSGYKDIRIAPTGFLVRAKDTDGNAVVMSVSPNSFTEVTDLNGMDRSTTGSATNPGSSEKFVSVPNDDELSSKVVGLDIYNDSKQDIGQIKDIAMN